MEVQGIKFTHVAGGHAHTIAVAEGGNVWTFGRGDNGQLGHGAYTNLRSPELLTSLDSMACGAAVRVAAGSKHSAVCTERGEVWTFGDNRDGQLGAAEEGLGGAAGKDVVVETCDPIRVPLPLLPNGTECSAVDVSAGGLHTMVLSSAGSVVAFGYSGRNGRLGLGHTVTQFDPTPVTFFNDEAEKSDKRYTHKVVDALMPGKQQYGKGRLMVAGGDGGRTGSEDSDDSDSDDSDISCTSKQQLCVRSSHILTHTTHYMPPVLLYRSVLSHIFIHILCVCSMCCVPCVFRVFPCVQVRSTRRCINGCWRRTLASTETTPTLSKCPGKGWSGGGTISVMK